MKYKEEQFAKTVVGAIVALLLVLAIAVPIIDGAQKTVGEPITLMNNSAVVLTDANPGDILKVDRVYSDATARVDTWYYNDVVIDSLSAEGIAWDAGIISDGLYLQIFGITSTSAGVYYDLNSNGTTPYYFGDNGSPVVGNTYTTKFEFGEDSISVVFEGYTLPGEEITTNYSWAKVVCSYKDAKYTAAVPGGVGFVNDINDLILCGSYTSGLNDTGYYSKDGQLYLSNSSFEGNINMEKELHEGTTDIYDITVSVDVGNENFTPYRIYVPYEVEGHQTNGAVYTMFGILPIVLIVSIIMSIVGATIIRRDY